MRFEGIKIGFALTGSHCTLKEVLEVAETLIQQGADLTPIISYAVNNTDTRFGKAEEWRRRLKALTGKEPLNTIEGVEPIGPRAVFDCLIIAPCTGNTLAKLANGITDTPVLMAAKAHLRNLKPLIVAVSTNDALGLNAKNIGILLESKHIYLVPLGQDSPQKKVNSLVAHMGYIPDTIEQALRGQQIQPVFLEYRE